ncbi:hypothetical protein D3870_16850 [Noviherbaspirillum cavernae]|uniref:Uncharacterized protein n=1 Tax=Noviherbaspirillum cavernae TaxID=2320862 RepID=A0A418X4N5_9BURK|nr:hypothetical protein [Noviherbaspirillum cavernae]RJG07443.1 hypothetical protein D3870_16850 [Noviherbaspirillum cavernae]
MSFSLDALALPFLLLLAVNAAGILLYAASVRLKARREQRHVADVAAAIIDYFKRSGVNVATSCTRLPGKSQYTAFIESEPMKRFRLSHIIEMTLKEHVRKACGQELGKVYWRFPIKEVKEIKDTAAAGEAAAQDAPAPEAVAGGKAPVSVAAGTDEYINEGLENYKYIPKVEATELSWEHFEQASGNTDGPQLNA